MPLPSNSSLSALLASAFIAFAAPQTLHAAEAFPAKPVRLVVPFAPGGGTDIMARTLGQKLSDMWSQQIVVDNRGGGGTVIGTELAVRAPADGYTLMLANIALALNPGLKPNLPYDAIKDLAPVILIASQPSAVAVNPSFPAKNVKELIAAAKNGKLNFGSSGSGGVGHIGGEMFKNAIGASMQHIPYKGGGPAAVDLMAGQIPIAFISLPTVTPYIKSGRLRVLAITDSKRSAAAPDIPTVGETVKGFAVDNWIGMLAPAKTPKEIITKVNADILKAISTPELKDRLTQQGFDVEGGTPEQFGKVIRGDIDKYTKVIRSAGIKE